MTTLPPPAITTQLAAAMDALRLARASEDSDAVDVCQLVVDDLLDRYLAGQR